MSLTLERLEKARDAIDYYVFDSNYILESFDAWECHGKDIDVFSRDITFFNKNKDNNLLLKGKMFVVFMQGEINYEEIYAQDDDGVLMGRQILETQLTDNFDIFNPMKKI